MSETSGFLIQPGGRIAWRRIEGEGPPVVWLGGFNSDMTGTKAQALSDWAAGAGRAFLRFDYFGHGASDAPADPGRYTIAHEIEDVIGVLDHLSIPRAVFVGYSMGGRVALATAIAAPASTTCNCIGGT